MSVRCVVARSWNGRWRCVVKIVEALWIVIVVVIDGGSHIELYLKDALIGFNLKHHFDEFVRRGWIAVEDLLQERGT